MVDPPQAAPPPQNAKNARFGDPGLKRAAGIFVTGAARHSAIVASRRRTKGERHSGRSVKMLRLVSRLRSSSWSTQRREGPLLSEPSFACTLLEAHELSQ